MRGRSFFPSVIDFHRVLHWSGVVGLLFEAAFVAESRFAMSSVSHRGNASSGG